MTLPSDTREINEIVTRFANNYVGGSEYKNNFYTGRAAQTLLRERSMNERGGDRISHRVNLGTTPVGGSYPTGGNLALTKTGERTRSDWEWSFNYEPAVIYFQELFKTEGTPERVIGLVEDTVDETGELIKDTIDDQIWATSQASATDLIPMFDIVKSTGAAGGLNPSTSGQSAWASKTLATFDFSSVGIAKMRTGASNASMGQRYKIDAWVLTETFYNEALEIADNKVQINADVATRRGTTNGELGQENLAILNRPTIWDTSFSTNFSDRILGLDFDGVHLIENSQFSLKLEPWKKTYANHVDAMVTIQRYIAALTCSRRQSQVYFTSVS